MTMRWFRNTLILLPWWICGGCSVLAPRTFEPQPPPPDRELGDLYQAVSEHPESAAAYYELGQALLKRGEFNLAIGQFRQAVEMDPNHVNALLELARLAYLGGLKQEALSYCEQAQKAAPQDARVQNECGKLFLQMNMPARAERAFRKVVEAKKETVDTWLGRAYIAFRRKNYSEAQRWCQRAQAEAPEDARVYGISGLIFKAQGRLSHAEEALDKAVSLDPSATEFRRQLALVQQAEKKFTQAVEQWQALIDLQPHSPEPYLAWVQTLVVQDRLQEAEEVCLKGLQTTPDYAPLLNLLGEVLVKQKQPQQALPYFEKAVRNDPSLIQAQLNLGDVQVRQEHYEEAIEAYQKAAQLAPEAARVHLKLGYGYERGGKADRAVQSYRKALALNLDLAPACNNLAYLLLQKKKHVAEAFRLAQRAVAHAPGEGTFWDTLGWAYYHQGNLKAAVHNLQRAVEIKKDPIFLYHLAIVYRDQGKEEQAKEEARAALRISSHFPEVEKCRNLLRALEHPRSGR